jgi:glycine/D-amino acid oxidase-like deaminating enzyme/nitrite reductase/ring-hydroxylating ferredoxin subunit
MGDSREYNSGLPGKAESYWIDSSPPTAYPPLDGERKVDVAVVGAGIAGISAAFMLKRAGLTVALVDARRIGTGTTGYTTAKITSLHRLIYRHLIERFGVAKARQYADANQAAIETIATYVREFSIPCGFERKPAYTFAESEESRNIVEAEADAAKGLGLPASYVEEIPLPVETFGAVRFESQAQFHPRNYLLALAERIEGEGSSVLENTRALAVEEREDGVSVRTERGSILADHLILATHYPIHDRPGAYYARMQASRSYALGIRVGEPFPDGIFINAEGSVHSWRSHPDDGGDLVIVTGAAHGVGQVADTRERYRNVEAYARLVYPVTSVDYHWSAQDYITADRVPYIGRLAPGHDRVYVATGFGKWGMTAGTAAAMILSDLVLGRSSPWSEVFDPGRFTEEPGYPEWVAGTLRSAGGEVEIAAARFEQEVSAIPRGEGKVIEAGGQKVAVYRDEDGGVHTLDPTCMHMACTVAWNNAESSWDCPCHGSRYDARGKVIQSPTVRDLAEKTVRKT